MAATVDPDHEGESAPPAGFHAGQGILDDRGPSGIDAQPAGGLDEEGRVWLPWETQAVRVPAVHPHREQVLDAGRRQHLPHVAAGGGDRGSHATAEEFPDERDR